MLHKSTKVITVLVPRVVGGENECCRGFAKKIMPHIWRIVQIWFDKSPPQIPCAPGGWGGVGLVIDSCITKSIDIIDYVPGIGNRGY